MPPPAETIDDPLALESLLRWYAAMGVDAAIDETPHDRFAMPEPTPALDASRIAPSADPARPPARATPIRGGAPVVAGDTGQLSGDALIRQAEALAAGAATLEALHEGFAVLPGCGLAATAARMILSGGTRGAPIMLIGGAPASDDEREGTAFAGDGGKLLDAMLGAIGLDRSGVYLANVIPWRPPGNRTPTPLELALCMPFTRRHIALAAPKLLVCLGERAAQPLLDTKDTISRLRGRWVSHEGASTTVKTLVTFSPDYLLKQPLQKRRAWADLRMLSQAAAQI